MSSATQDRLCTPNDRELFLRCEGEPDCETAMVVVHGLGEHSGCYDDFVNRMLAKNRGVLVYDQQGHGKSPGRRGDAPDFDTWVNDIAVALEYASKRFPEAELILLGHSMGGNLVLNHLLDRDHEYVSRAIVTNPMILPPNPPTKPQAFAAGLTGKLIPRIRFSASIDPTDLTHDVEVLRERGHDDLMHEQLAIGVGSELINQGIWLREHADHLRRDLLILTGSEDELCDRETTEAFVASAGDRCTQRDFEGLRHSLLLEKDREPVYDAIECWLHGDSVTARRDA